MGDNVVLFELPDFSLKLFDLFVHFLEGLEAKELNDISSLFKDEVLG
jgi:hypothetical protein